MVQYITVPGEARDVLSVFRLFAGEISLIKITKNDNERALNALKTHLFNLVYT